MKSLSRIIKSDELLLDEPRVLDNFNEIIEEPTAVENTGVVDIDIEARNIIQETEEMVLDLLDKARVEAADLIENASSEAEEIKAGPPGKRKCFINRPENRPIRRAWNKLTGRWKISKERSGKSVIGCWRKPGSEKSYYLLG